MSTNLTENDVRNLSAVRNRIVTGSPTINSGERADITRLLDSIINPAVESLVAQKRAELDGLARSLRGEKVAAPVEPQPDTFIEFDDFHSSNIDVIFYNPARRIMRVKFNSGSIYDYADVPREVVDDVTGAYSVGSTFNSKVKGRFVSSRRRDLED